MKFLISLVLLVSYLCDPKIKVNFELFCDDYCSCVKNGNKDIYRSSTNACSIRRFEKEINIFDSLSFSTKNLQRDFGFSGAVDYHYFKITTSNKFIGWTISGEGNKCVEKSITGTYNPLKQYHCFGFKYGQLNYKTCTLSYSFSFCRNNNVYINDHSEIDFAEFLIAEKSEYFNDLDIIVFPNLSNNGSISYINGNEETRDTNIKGAYKIKYLVNEHYVNDTFSFKMISKDKQFSKDEIEFETCNATIVVCGEHCSLCDPSENYKCKQCDKGYAFKVDDPNVCYDKNDDIEKYYYQSYNNTFMKCHDNCKTCSQAPSNDKQNCDSCKDTDYYFLQDNYLLSCSDTCNLTLGNTQRCLTDCGDLVKENGKCVNECTNNNTFLVVHDDGTKTCENDCESLKLYPIKDQNKCIKSCASENLIIYEKDGKKECIEICNKYLEIKDNETVCVDNCSPSNPVYDPKTKLCVQACPGSTVYVEAEKKCLDQCPDKYPYTYNDKICVSNCTEYAESITDSSEKLLFLEGSKCVSSCSTNYFLVVDSNECVERCPDTFWKDDNKCVEECKDKIPLEGTRECVSDCPESYYKVDGIAECFGACPDSFPNQIDNSNMCFSDCPLNYPLLDEENHLCLDKCTDSPNAINQFEDKCVEECPPLYKVEDGICIIELHLESINETDSKIDISLNETVELVDKIIIDYINENKTIIGDDFIMQVYPSDKPPEDRDAISSIDTSQCEDILRRHYQIPDTEPLLIVKYDILNDTTLTNQVEYVIYNSKGEKLNMTLCEGVNSEISYPINDLIDLSKGEEMYLKGVDIYNGKSDYFNNLCTSYTNEGPNVLSDRRENDFQVATFCEEGCEYNGMNYQTKKVICSCTTKTQINTVYTNNNELRPFNSFKTKMKSSNILIMKCYKTLTQPSNWINNIAFWMFFSYIIFQVIFIFVFNYKDKNFILSNLNTANKGAPSIKEEIVFKDIYIKDNTINEPKQSELTDDDYFEEEYNEDNKYSISEKELMEKTSFPINRILFDVYLKEPKAINNYPYWLALQKEYRNCVLMFWDIYKEKHLLLSPFFGNTLFISMGINFSFFFLYLSLCFAFNGLFYTDSLIIKNYNKTVFTSIPHNLGKSFFSAILTVVIVRIIKAFNLFPQSIETLLLEIGNNEILNKYVIEVLKRTRNKIVIYLTIMFSLTLFFWYYLSIFCIIYSSIQIKWLIGGLISIVFIRVIDIVYCLLISILRIASIRCKSSCVYNIHLLLMKIY